MSGQENDEMGFQHHRNDAFTSNPIPEKVSGMALTSSMSMFKPSNGPSSDPFFGSGWDTLCSLGQSENFGGSSSPMVSHGGDFCNPNYTPCVLETQGMSSTVSHLVQYTADSSFAEVAPKLPCFGGGRFSDMAGSFGFPQDSCLMSEAVLGSSPNGKRRKRLPDSNSPLSCDKNGEEELKRDMSAEISDEKKLKVEEHASGNNNNNNNNNNNIGTKQSGKQAKENSNNEEPKENYIHVRARRGQATNSHSLAERVRREKISERMRLLQELVPGCNKITGKAVMLDEIINYVQSLQQQVEFLSMKLATVNPELNIDFERLLSKDILNTRGGAGGAIFGLGPGIGSSQHFPLGMLNGIMPNLPNANPQFSSLPQSVLDHELQGLLQMGFDSSSVIDNLGPNGRLKPEL